MNDAKNESMASSFPTTQWTVILEVIRSENSVAAENALCRFCEHYRPAVFKFLLRRGLDEEQAKEYTQDFFASRILEKWESRDGFLHVAERRENTKFRSFLCHVLYRFLQDKARAIKSAKAGGGVIHVSLLDPESGTMEAAGETVENFGHALDRALAIEIIQRAASRSNHSKYHLACLRGEMNQANAAEALGISENAFKQAHHRFHKSLRRHIVTEVSKLTGPDETEIQAEIRYLMSLFADGGQ